MVNLLFILFIEVVLMILDRIMMKFKCDIKTVTKNYSKTTIFCQYRYKVIEMSRFINRYLNVETILFFKMYIYIYSYT